VSEAKTRPSVLWIAVVVALTLAAAFAAYQQIFSTYADYDDEGTLMLSVVTFMQGHPLYVDTHSQYGPAYYALEAAFHRVTGLPVTHDVTRLGTVAVWLAVAWLGGLVVFRLTRSRWLAVAGGLVAFFHLERLCLEPGHPQELCALGVVVALVLCTRLGSMRTAAGLGFAAAVVVATKLNIGVFLLVSLTLTLLLLVPRDRLRPLLAAAVAAAVILPFVVTAVHLHSPSVRFLAILVAAATLAVAATALGADRPAIVTPAQLGAFVAVAVGGTLAWLATAVTTGSSVQSIVDALIVHPRQFVDAFATPQPFPRAVVLLAVLAAGGAFVARRAGRPIWRVVAQTALVGALAFACVRYLKETPVPLTHGLVDRGGAAMLVALALPMLWVVLAGADDDDGGGFGGRLGLCLVACLQPLAAYPTAGTQVAVGSLPLALGCVVALHDAARRASSPLVRWTPAVVVALLACTLLLRDVQFQRARAALTPLDLPGAARLRLAPARVADYQWLARTLRTNTDTFVFGEHARNSFYFWTAMSPPTALNAPFWTFLLTPAEQRRVIAALEGVPRAGVVHEMAEYKLAEDSPLLAYLAERFEPSEANGSFQVWRRKPAGQGSTMTGVPTSTRP
jgi:hypothetical protein